MSARRATGKNKHKNALERLKAQREAGINALDAYEVDADDRIYDEVNENDYQMLVRRRLQEDDFVVDDDGLGYVDYGEEDDDRRSSCSSAPSGEEGGPSKDGTKRQGPL